MGTKFFKKNMVNSIIFEALIHNKNQTSETKAVFNKHVK